MQYSKIFAKYKFSSFFTKIAILKKLGNFNFTILKLFLWFKSRSPHRVGLFIQNIIFLQISGMVATLGGQFWLINSWTMNWTYKEFENFGKKLVFDKMQFYPLLFNDGNPERNTLATPTFILQIQNCPCG